MEKGKISGMEEGKEESFWIAELVQRGCTRFKAELSAARTLQAHLVTKVP